jgi:hypothetical protein
MRRSRPYQFGIWRLIVLMTAVAAAFALAQGFSISPLGRGIAGVYFALLASWAVLRWPAVLANLAEVRQRRQAMLSSRRAMLSEVQRRREGASVDPNRAAKAPVGEEAASD